MKIAICDDREDDRGALRARLEAYGQDFEIREYGAGRSRMACEQGFLPIAPHLLFPQFLNEGVEEERRLGIAMGMELLALCDEVWVFGETTERMAAEIAHATAQGKKVITASLSSQCEHKGFIPVSNEPTKGFLLRIGVVEAVARMKWAWFSRHPYGFHPPVLIRLTPVNG